MAEMASPVGSEMAPSVVSEMMTPAASTSENTRVKEVIEELCRCSRTFSGLIHMKGTVLYGSLPWRILNVSSKVEKCIQDGETKPIDVIKTIVSMLLAEMMEQKSDIDLFISPVRMWKDKSEKIEWTNSPRDVSYRWLDWNKESKLKKCFETDAINSAETMKKALTTTKHSHQHSHHGSYRHSHVYDMVDEQKSSDRGKHGGKSVVPLGIFLEVQSMSAKLQIMDHTMPVQAHRRTLRSYDLSPKVILDEVYAPLFTVESLMYNAETGLVARFGCDVNEVLLHIKKKELHIVHPAEIQAHLRKQKNRHRIIYLSMMANRLVKYKKYGYSLKVTYKDALDYPFIHDAMYQAFYLHLMPYPDTRRQISKLIPFDSSGAFGSEEDKQRSKEIYNSAIACQLIYNDYIGRIILELTPLYTGVIDIVVKYAARSDEKIYSDDIFYQKEIEETRAIIEAKKNKLELLLADKHPRY